MATSVLARGSRLAVLAAVGLGVLLVAAPAQAEDYPYPPIEGTMSSSAADLEPGVSTTLSGSGFAPDAEVVITVESAPIHLGTTTADANGAFTYPVTIPPDLPAGTHTLYATGDAGGGDTLVLSTTFVVGGDDSNLPKTGYPIGLLASMSGLVLLGGLGVLGYGIRRRLRLSGPVGVG